MSSIFLSEVWITRLLQSFSYSARDRQQILANGMIVFTYRRLFSTPSIVHQVLSKRTTLFPSQIYSFGEGGVRGMVMNAHTVSGLAK